MKNKRVVITGVGIISPCGIGRRKFNSFLKKGKSAIRPITIFDTSKLANKQAGEATGFDPKRILGAKGLRHLTRSTEFSLAASKLALDDALLLCPVAESKADSYGVSLGISTGSTHSFMDFHKEILKDGPRFLNPLSFPNASPNAIASQISIRFNIKGFNTTISSPCSSLDAINYAGGMIRNYGYKVVLAGGVEELSLEAYIGLIKLKCLSRTQGGREVSSPYDSKRGGVIAAEGACIFILEDYEYARNRNAKLYAELKGYGSSFDTRTRKGFSPGAEGASKAIRKAISEFSYPQKRLDCIIGSANSTRGLDYTEARAINSVFKERAKQIPVTSIKSMIGESFSASGAFNIAAAIYALESGIIPPTINYRSPDKRIGLNIVANRPRRKKLNNILINSFGHSGSNASFIIGR